MDLMLDGRGRLYLQLARALRQAIISGRVPDGSRIPPSRRMADSTGLSRATVVAAYARLQSEGLLATRVGDGSYACAPPSVASPAGSGIAADDDCPPQSGFARRARAASMVLRREGERTHMHRYALRYDALELASSLPDDWARCMAQVAPYVKPGYPDPQGTPRLREAIALHVRMARGIDCHADDVLVVNGTRQAYSLATRVLLDAGDTAAIEDPQYSGIRCVLQAEGVELRGVPVDGDGMCVDLLAGQHARAVFVMPSHQFPLGSVLALERRLALIDHARRTAAWIIEDDFGAEFRHGTPSVATLQALDGGQRVVHVGSFSRTLFPAMRLGYIVIPRALRGDFIAAKTLTDFGVSPFEQEALAELVGSGAYAAHVRRCTQVLADRRTRLRDALAAACPAMQVTGGDAGMHLVGWLDGVSPPSLSRLVGDAGRRGLAVDALAPFYLRPPARQALMLGLGCLHAADIPEAVRILAECVAVEAGGDRGVVAGQRAAAVRPIVGIQPG